MKGLLIFLFFPVIVALFFMVLTLCVMFAPFIILAKLAREE
jgi:hypothetical protein